MFNTNKINEYNLQTHHAEVQLCASPERTTARPPVRQEGQLLNSLCIQLITFPSSPQNRQKAVIGDLKHSFQAC